MLDPGLSTLITDLDERGLLSETLVVCVGEFGRSPLRGVSTSGNSNDANGRDHWPYCYTGVVAGAGVRRGYVHGRSDATASAPLENPVHPKDLLATIYHCDRPRPAHDRVQPPQPAARDGAGRRGERDSVVGRSADMNLRFQRGDIVVNGPEFTPGCYCILDVIPSRPRYPYSGVNLVNLKTYQLTDESLTKVGTATEEFLQGHASNGSLEPSAGSQADQLRFQRGQARAMHELWSASGDDKQRRRLLANAKPGDNIPIQYGCGHVRQAKFRLVLDRGSKYVFLADTAPGATVKFPLGAIALHPAPASPTAAGSQDGAG